jgi:hypothetical protein
MCCCGEFPLPAGDSRGRPPLISNALSGNCNVVDLALDKVPHIDGGLVPALGNNNSLLSLAFSDTVINEDNWTALCQLLASNSKLVHLRLHRTFPHEPTGTCTKRKVLRDNAFLQMLLANTTLQELDARVRSFDPNPQGEFDEDTLSDVILPYLRRLRTSAVTA